MRKLFLTAVVAVFSLTAINAQEIKFGAKAGLNVAMLTGKSAEDGKALTSFHVGVMAELGLSDKLAIQPELVYSIQGAKQEQTQGGVKTTGKNTLAYLNLPIMAKYLVTENFSVEFGPQIGFLMSAKEDYEITSSLGTVKRSDDVKEYYNGIDFGLGIGAGYKLDNGLSLGARYNLGLSNITNQDKQPNTELKNGVIQISVGYFFN